MCTESYAEQPGITKGDFISGNAGRKGQYNNSIGLGREGYTRKGIN